MFEYQGDTYTIQDLQQAAIKRGMDFNSYLNVMKNAGLKEIGGTEQSATVVPFFSAAGGLTTANANFNFNATVDEKFVFTGSKTFTLSNGSNLSDSNITLFQF